MRNRSRFLPLLLTAGLVVTAAIALVAVAIGQSDGGGSANSQYCPPSSPGAGQPKDPGPGGNACGTPGSPGNPNAPGQNKPKKTRHRVTSSPEGQCAHNSFRARYVVIDRPAGSKSRVYLDGKRIRTTEANSFLVRIKAKRLKPGVHRLVIKTRGQDRRVVTKTVRFRVCKR